MNSREEIQELNDHLQAFPKVEDIFVKDQPWLKNHFLPLMSIDLAEINPDWVGSGGYIICFMSLLAVLCYSLLIIRKKNKLINIKNNDNKRRNPRTERPFAGVPQSGRHLCKRATVAQKSFSAPDAYRFS